MAGISSVAFYAARHASAALKSGYHINHTVAHETEKSLLETRFAPLPHGAAPDVEFGRWPEHPCAKPSPITWQVLAIDEDGGLLLTTRYIIECSNGHDMAGDTSWQQSSMRLWMNKVFYNFAFSEREKRLIETVRLITTDNVEFKMAGCPPTENRVFALSIAEAEMMFEDDAQRKAELTPYAKRLKGVPSYWLRSPGGHQFSFAAVGRDGNVDRNGFHATLDSVGLRPCIVLAPDGLADLENAPHERDPFDLEEALRNAGDTSSFFGRRQTRVLANAIRYADEEDVRKLVDLGDQTMRGGKATRAVGGGFPSCELLCKLVDDGLFRTSERYEIGIAAARVEENKLVRKLVRSTKFTVGQVRQIMTAAVESANVDLVRFFLKRGTTGVGYADAYLPNNPKEEVVTCVVIADPHGALQHWQALKKHPQAIKALVHECERADALVTADELLEKEGLLDVCAANDFRDELRLIIERATSAPALSALQGATLEAQVNEHAECTAYLLNQQALHYGMSYGSAHEPSGTDREESAPALPDLFL